MAQNKRGVFLQEYERDIRELQYELESLVSDLQATTSLDDLEGHTLAQYEDRANAVLNLLIPLLEDTRAYRAMVGSVKAEKRIAKRQRLGLADTKQAHYGN